MTDTRVIEIDIHGERWRVTCATDWVGVAQIQSPRGMIYIPAKLVKGLIDYGKRETNG